MMPMDHAAAHDRIEDLLLEPARLDDLSASNEPGDVALRDHLAGCPACRADLESWRGLQHSVADALPAGDAAARAAVLPVELPPSLRAATINAIRVPRRGAAPARAVATRAPMRSARGWWRPRFALPIAAAAALALVVGAGLVTVDQVNQRTFAEADARSLSNALAAVNRVLVAPGHKAITLQTPGGVAAGSVSWSSHDLVVLTTALVQPAPGRVYRCWLVDGSSSLAIGSMDFAGRTAYWVGSLDAWATFQIGPSTRFVVTLEPMGGTERTGADVLAANLGS